MHTVFVTGADKGLGYCLADTFAREGCRVFAGHLGDGDILAKLAAVHEDRVIPVRQDVTDQESIRQSVASVAGQADGLDILINSAGITTPDKHCKLEDSDLWNGWPEKTLTVNSLGPPRVTQAFMPLLERGNLKKIAIISSEAGSIGENWRDFGYAYSMSKAACNMFAQILRKALAPRGYTVLLFHPGWMRTEMGGSDAHISAETAAEGIYKLTMRQWAPEDPMYMDYTGRVFPW